MKDDDMTTTSVTDSSDAQARQLIAALHTHACPLLAAALDPGSLAKALTTRATHKVHPIVDLAARAGHPGNSHADHVRGNLERALQGCRADPGAAKWANDHLNRACEEPAIENACGLVGELRAFGTLWDAGFRATPVPTSSVATRDFDVARDGVHFGVEVHSKQMNDAQSAALAGATAARAGTTFVYPAGQPRPNETTAENVASKFAQIKPRARQAAAQLATILWLDLQDPDWWPFDASHAEPVVARGKQFYSGGLWQAVYGTKGTPIFEYHRTEPGGFEGVPVMGHPGMFEQAPAWAEVILSMSRGLIFFENPAAKLRLDARVLQAMPSLMWFDLGRSRMDWPHPRLAHQLDADRELLTELSRRAMYQW